MKVDKNVLTAAESEEQLMFECRPFIGTNSDFWETLAVTSSHYE